MAPLIIGRPDRKGSTGRDHRVFVEGVRWILRTVAPWRDLPEVFGDWNSVFRRVSRLSDKGVWRRIFEAMSDDPDVEFLRTPVPARQAPLRTTPPDRMLLPHAQAASPRRDAIGKDRQELPQRRHSRRDHPEATASVHTTRSCRCLGPHS